MQRKSDAFIARLATGVALTGFVSVLSLGLFFAVQGPFGAINDWTVGILGVLSGLLAWRLARRGAGQPQVIGSAALVAATVGALIVVVGAALVISRTTGFLLAGLVESLGFAMIGVWLVSFNRQIRSTAAVPRWLPVLGITAGFVMAVGFVVAPGVLMRLDDMNTAPGWVWIGFVGWLGIFFLYPVWSLGLGRAREGRAETGGPDVAR